MAKLTQNFTIEELTFSQTAIRNNIINKPGEDELKALKSLCENVLEPLRVKINSPLIISSGFRNKVTNHLVGGAASSQHIVGEAVDLIAKNYTVKRFYEIIKELVKDGKIVVDQCILEYDRWVHLSYTTKRNNRNKFMIKDKSGYREDSI